MRNEEILENIERHGARLTEGAQREMMERYIEELVLWGRRMHLVGKKRFEETLSAQIVDSLAMLEFAEDLPGSPLARENEALAPGAGGGEGGKTYRPKVADIGTGPGFPGMVWKIASPSLEITLFERKERTSLFLERVTARLKLEGIKAVCADAVAYGGKFDLVVSKAAGKLEAMLPVAAELLTPGGIYVTIKGAGSEGELSQAGAAGGRLAAQKRSPSGNGVILAYAI